MTARAHNSDPWPTPNSRLKLISYLDRLAENAGGPKVWLRIMTAFRLRDDPGASFALASSLEAAMAMADNLGFGGLAHVTKARPIIRAVSAALLEVPEQARLKLANAQLGTHRCSGSPSEFPLLCCFTTEISDPAIVSRIVALRSFVLLGVVFETDRSAQLKVVADGLRKAQTLPHPWADRVVRAARDRVEDERYSWHAPPFAIGIPIERSLDQVTMSRSMADHRNRIFLPPNGQM